MSALPFATPGAMPLASIMGCMDDASSLPRPHLSVCSYAVVHNMRHIAAVQVYLSPEHAKAMVASNSQGPVYRLYVSGCAV
jgi:hypothetical protein